ncbi:type IV secretory system conjugative DNA transfer family protein [Actinokineospora bangkokensis]|uniref:TraD/TraG TraM recognition site domain-containing protein n=1 Tax=Actinokineospora bangkokensis TaxID=1193682 RepID=A0A1Q9LKL2_9PSEU|nr:TraM recognition domain-containing protein [Actinokineospora bangkokensis]OLR92586.1 hypothetical protein BJP25_21280 [Actinokineospora bangkokensis]
MRTTSLSFVHREVAVLLTALAGLCLLVLTAALLMTGAAVSTALLGGPWSMPTPGRWGEKVLAVLTHPSHPGTDLGPPWSDALTGHAGTYWVVTGALAAAAMATALAAAKVVMRLFGRASAGHASRDDIRAELSLAAARRTAQWTRPTMPAAARERAPLEQVAAPLHLSPWKRPMGTPFENPTGTLAPTQSGKSRRDLVHKVIGAPGAVLCSTTKPDLLEFSGILRARRQGAGPVLVADATGAVDWPARLLWSPMQGCHDPTVAFRRAHTMVEASSVGLSDIGGNDRVFRGRATIVLQCYFLAAACHERTVDDLVRWAMSKPVDQEPVRLLQQAGFDEHARNLRTEIGMVAETSDAVWLSVRRVIEPFMDPNIRTLASPEPGHEFDAADFIARRGSLYLVAGQHQAAQAAPVLTALVEHWLTTAQDAALRTPHRRLDPPATAILDELTNATPVPQLPDIVSDSAGRGVPIHWGAQSLAALEDVFTPERTRQLLDNTTTLSVWGGIKDPTTLEWVSTLTGHHERIRRQEQSAGMLGTSHTSYGTETVPTYRPGDVRGIRRGRVLVLHRHLDPILARTRDVSQRPDWKTIRDHVHAVRNGEVPLDAHGTAHPLDHPRSQHG